VKTNRRLQQIGPRQEVRTLVEALRRQADKLTQVARELTLAAERLERGDGDDLGMTAEVKGDGPRILKEILDPIFADILDRKAE